MIKKPKPLEKTPFIEGISPIEAQQIASVLSGQLKVKIKKGQQWLYNFPSKTIHYRPEDLYRLRQLDVVANLLHEAGHAKYSTWPKKLKNWVKIPKEKENHKEGLKELLNAIEDFRIEDKLRKEYPYAKDYLPLYSFKTKFILEQLSQQFIRLGQEVPRIIVYCVGIYAKLAKMKFKTDDKEIIEKVNLTYQSAFKARKTKNTNENLEIIINEIYPHIKDLLDEYQPPALRPSVTFCEGEEQPISPYENLYPTIKHLIKPTIARFNRLLTDTKFDKLAGKFRTGKQLDKRRLYKFRLGETRLFQRRIEASTKDYVIALVVDESGSMYYGCHNLQGEDGYKIKQAIKTTILFSHVLHTLKIPFSLHGFNEFIKDYKQPKQSFLPFNRQTNQIFQSMYDNASKTGQGNAHNNDGQAINQVAKQLLDFKGKKIMIVISDGQPAPYGEGANYDLRKEIVKAEKQGIEMIGLGIGDGCQAVKEYYPKYVTVKEIDELPQALITSLKNKLKK